jgi:prephenate dehydratase
LRKKQKDILKAPKIGAFFLTQVIMEKTLKIAIQGGLASFHDVVARQYFEQQPTEIIPCLTFQQVCTELRTGNADFAVMAIENTLAGSILGNYTLLQANPFHIIGERYLRIEQNLMALPGQTLDDIKTVRSHPMALLQCSKFLQDHQGMQALEAADTAESAREIREKNLLGVAAVASRLAAERYQLDILQERIEDFKDNYTRFLILARESKQDDSDTNKASVILRLYHRVGELGRVLEVFKRHYINMSLIQSIPNPIRQAEFSILVDLEYDFIDGLRETLAEVEEIAINVNILGVYRRGGMR